MPRRVDQADAEVAPKRVYITRNELKKYGYTDGCPGCAMAQIGLPTKDTVKGAGKGWLAEWPEMRMMW